jgi:hypothetical protein
MLGTRWLSIDQTPRGCGVAVGLIWLVRREGSSVISAITGNTKTFGRLD